MDAGYITALAALGGAALGGFTSFATSWTTLRTQMKAEGNASSKARRRKLYRLFINQASKIYGDALIHDSPELAGLVELHALVNRMRIIMPNGNGANGPKFRGCPSIRHSPGHETRCGKMA